MAVIFTTETTFDVEHGLGSAGVDDLGKFVRWDGAAWVVCTSNDAEDELPELYVSEADSTWWYLVHMSAGGFFNNANFAVSPGDLSRVGTPLMLNGNGEMTLWTGYPNRIVAFSGPEYNETPTIMPAQTRTIWRQADWNQTDPAHPAFIRNKPV